VLQWIFKISSSGSNAGVETFAPLVSVIVTNALFHSSQHVNQTLPQIINILLFCLVDSLLNYAPSFVVNWVEVMAVRLPQIWRDNFAWRLASLSSWARRLFTLFRARSRCIRHALQMTGRDPSVSIWHIVVGLLGWCQLLLCSQTFFNICALRPATVTPSVGASCSLQLTQ